MRYLNSVDSRQTQQRNTKPLSSIFSAISKELAILVWSLILLTGTVASLVTQMQIGLEITIEDQLEDIFSCCLALSSRGAPRGKQLSPSRVARPNISQRQKRQKMMMMMMMVIFVQWWKAGSL